MKKIFTLISVALCAMGIHAQTEVWKAEVLKDPTAMKENGTQHAWEDVLKSAIISSENASPNVVFRSNANPLPWPGKVERRDENGNIIYAKDAEGNITTTPEYDPLFTDPSTVESDGLSTSKLYDYVIEAATANVSFRAICTPNLGETQSWGFGLAQDPEVLTNNRSLLTDECDPKFLDYIKAKSGNCTDKYIDWYEYIENGDIVHRTANDKWDPTKTNQKPAMGSWFELTTKKAGRLKVGIFVPKNIQNNKLFIAKLNADGQTFELLSPEKVTLWGWVNNTTSSDKFENVKLQSDYRVVEATNLQNPFLGYATIDAEANTTYMYLTPDNQLGIYGFEFTPGEESGIITVKAGQSNVAPMYNLSGQKVDNGYKGIVIQNGVKRIQK